MSDRAGLARNPALLCAHRAVQMSLFPIAVITIFWQHDLGLTMAEIFTLQAIFAGATGLCEFPSGLVADRIGYRRSLVLASLLTLLGWTVYLFSPDFWTLAVAEVVLGVGLSLISGTDAALLYESLLESGDEASYARWAGRVRFFGQAAEGTAALVAGLLYAVSPRLPFVLEVGVWVIGVAVALALVEPARRRPREGSALAHMRSVVVAVLTGAPRLRAVMTVTVLLGLTSFVPVWIIQLYAVNAGVALAWLGPIWAAANWTVALTSLASDRLGRSLGLVPALAVCIALAAAGFLGLGLFTAWWSFAFYFLITAMRGLNGPILSHEEQRFIPSADRASYVSFRSLAFRVAFVAIGPAIGLGIDARGEHLVLLWAGAAFALTGAASVAWLARTPSTVTPVPDRS